MSKESIQTELEALLKKVSEAKSTCEMPARNWFQCIFIAVVVILLSGAGAIYVYRRWWGERVEDEELVVTGPAYKRLLEDASADIVLPERPPSDQNFTPIDVALAAKVVSSVEPAS